MEPSTTEADGTNQTTSFKIYLSGGEFSATPTCVRTLLPRAHSQATPRRQPRSTGVSISNAPGPCTVPERWHLHAPPRRRVPSGGNLTVSEGGNNQFTIDSNIDLDPPTQTVVISSITDDGARRPARLPTAAPPATLPRTGRHAVGRFARERGAVDLPRRHQDQRGRCRRRTNWTFSDAGPLVDGTSYTYTARVAGRRRQSRARPPCPSAITIDTGSADGGGGDHRDCRRHRHVIERLHHQRHHADGVRHQRRARRRREGAGQQRRRRHLGGCDAGTGTTWSYADPAPARHELHLPGAGGGHGRQCRQHRQPGGHHRHGSADGDAGDHRDCHRHRHVIERLHHQRHHADGVRHQRRAGLPARRCRSAATAAPPGRDVTQARHDLELRRSGNPHGTSFTYQARVVDTAGNVGNTDQPGDHHRHGSADGDAGDHRDCHRHRHGIERLHHQRHHADGVRHQRRAGVRARRCRSAATAAPPGRDVTQARHDLELRRPATRTARASPTRRGWWTRPAISATPTSQAITIDTAAPTATLAITAIADRHRHGIERLHHQRHHADGVRHQRRAGVRARRCRSAATAAPPGRDVTQARHDLEL